MRNIPLFIVLGVIVTLMTSCRTHISDEVYEEGAYWIHNYFQQHKVVTPEPGMETISAVINGMEQEFELKEFPDSFMEWNISSRIETLNRIRRMERPELAGPHNGIVATYGIRRGDTRFSLNNAVKGMGFLPRYDRIQEVLELLSATQDADWSEKLDVLQQIYEDADELFDKNRQVSLELYSQPDFETQTFLNQMSNPKAVIVFLDIPSFKLKTISRLLHPEDPDLTIYEQQIIRYVNDVYRYFHGGRGEDYITVIYYVTEIYDNSPGRRDARGLRIDEGD